MTEDETHALDREYARTLFDAALDGELDPDTRHAFERALASDAELRADFERQRALLSATAQLGGAPTVDLLAGVQHKLRARSGGKFYRDRFSQRGPASSASLRLLIVLSASLVLAVLLWFAYDAGLLSPPR